MEDVCGGCRFWKGTREGHEGHCYAHPPQLNPVFVLVEVRKLEEEFKPRSVVEVVGETTVQETSWMAAQSQAAWERPVVFCDDDACGEYQPKETPK